MVNIKADNGRYRNDNSWKSPKCLKFVSTMIEGCCRTLDLHVTFTDMDIGLKSHTCI